MTLIIPSGGEEAAEEILLVAERHFSRMLLQIDTVIGELQGARKPPSREAQAAIRELSKAIQTIFDERAKLEKLRKHKAGVVHDHALDFDAARAEIGRRMARLRAARGSGEVPE